METNDIQRCQQTCPTVQGVGECTTSKGDESIDHGIGKENASPQRVQKYWTMVKDKMNKGKAKTANKKQDDKQYTQK